MDMESVPGGIDGFGSMLEAVDDALSHMTWLRPTDYAMVALAKRYAAEMDAAAGDGRAVGYLGMNLANALRSLGGSPVERKALDVEGSAGGRLGELRKARASRVS